LDISGAVVTVSSLAGDAGTVVTNSGGTAAAMTLGNLTDVTGNTSTFAGQFTAATVANLQFTKLSAGTLVLNTSTPSTATGALILTGGTLKLDYSAAGSNTGNIYGPAAPTFSGGTLNVTGRNSGTVTQTLGNLTLGAVGGKITMVDASTGTRSTTLQVGTITQTAAGGSLIITSPANTAVKTSTLIAGTAGSALGRLVFVDGSGVVNWANNGGSATNALTGSGVTYVDVGGTTIAAAT